MSNKWKDEFTDQLCDAIVAISSRDEAYRFLEDVATFSEIKAFSQRLQVASLLIKGLSYPQIVQATGASTATISRVKKCVEYGSDGYRDVLGKLNDKEARQENGTKKKK
ncbi:MAG: DNA-binding transcriptional regulator [Synergistes sp.]|nr:DNA-binding transcriptional regulator [Synergistes sp.]MCR5335991.1 DNA-binding transcriptional regulator [Synergistes sp.]